MCDLSTGKEKSRQRQTDGKVDTEDLLVVIPGDIGIEVVFAFVVIRRTHPIISDVPIAVPAGGLAGSFTINRQCRITKHDAFLNRFNRRRNEQSSKRFAI